MVVVGWWLTVTSTILRVRRVSVKRLEWRLTSLTYIFHSHLAYGLLRLLQLY